MLIFPMIENSMKPKLPHFIIVALVGTLLVTACAPDATPTPVDIAATIAVQLASDMLTQTAIANVPPPSPTPLPVTDTPIPTETPIPEPTKDQEALRIILVKGANPNPACLFGPGGSYGRVTFINTPKEVELLGMGNVPGWIVIKNPYYGSPCWLPQDAVEIDPALDLSLLPVLAP